VRGLPAADGLTGPISSGVRRRRAFRRLRAEGRSCTMTSHECAKTYVSPTAGAGDRRADGVPREGAGAAPEPARRADLAVRRAVAVRACDASELRPDADARAGLESDAAR